MQILSKNKKDEIFASVDKATSMEDTLDAIQERARETRMVSDYTTLVKEKKKKKRKHILTPIEIIEERSSAPD